MNQSNYEACVVVDHFVDTYQETLMNRILKCHQFRLIETDKILMRSIDTDLNYIKFRTKELIQDLGAYGFKVKSYTLVRVLIDSSVEDGMDLLC